MFIVYGVLFKEQLTEIQFYTCIVFLVYPHCA